MKTNKNLANEQIIQQMEMCSTNEFRNVFFKLLKKAQIGENAEYVILTIRNKSERIYLNNVLTKNNRSNASEINPQKLEAKIYFDDFAYLMEFVYGETKINNFVDKVNDDYPYIAKLIHFDGDNSRKLSFRNILRIVLSCVELLILIDPMLMQDGLTLENILNIIRWLVSSGCIDDIFEILARLKNLKNKSKH